MVLAAVFGGADAGAIIGAVITYGILWGIAVIPAYFWQKRMHDFLLPALGFLWLPAALLYFSYRGIASFAQTAPIFLVGLLLLKLAIVNNLFNVARTRNGPHRIARRKTLVAAREFFARELKNPRPRLEDRLVPLHRGLRPLLGSRALVPRVRGSAGRHDVPRGGDGVLRRIVGFASGRLDGRWRLLRRGGSFGLLGDRRGRARGGGVRSVFGRVRRRWGRRGRQLRGRRRRRLVERRALFTNSG